MCVRACVRRGVRMCVGERVTRYMRLHNGSGCVGTCMCACEGVCM